ncbi:MAG: hypothetical protein ACFFCI_18380 [Promethearchaeota archaeon]
MKLWIVILKNEIRKKSYYFRKNRKLYFILLYSLFLFWATYLGPSLFDAIIPEVVKNISHLIIPIFSTLIEYSFMVLLVLYVMYPIFMLYRKSEIGHKEILLTSPAKPGDIFLGEFLGQLPFYFLFILAVGPLVNSILLQLNPNLSFFDFILFYIVIFTLQIFGLIVGSIIANWLEFKMTKSKKSNQLNYSLFVLFSLLIIGSFYFFHFIFDFIDIHPEFKKWIAFYPSYWYSNILLFIVDSTLVEGYFLNIWASFGLALGIPLLLLYISYKKAKIFYKIETQIEKGSRTVKREGKILQIIRKVTPRGYENFVVIQFKEFFRKRENFPKLLYIAAFTAILGIFMYISIGVLVSHSGTIMIIGPYIMQIAYSDHLLLMALSWIGGILFGIFIGIYILISSKNIIFLYKKSIRGVKTLIFSFLIEMLYIIIFIDILLTIFFTLLFPLNIYTAMTFFFSYLINSFLVLVHAIGIQCIKPLYGERGKHVYFNMYLIVLIQIVSLFIAIFLVIPNIPSYLDHSLAMLYILLVNLGISSGFAVLLLYFGIYKLNRTE